ncbi:hypothetical protein BGZ63DRAFT_270281 [Mariannaea sp. PMI_226]|nr:hypothetical protein BGZ63DRAFT_270281 [Mariannaea sp. PMI_226]
MPQLLDLPPEILQAICKHCIFQSLFSSSSSTLARLSRTCSTLRAIGQPELYRSPIFTGHNFISLVRTLVNRPDLARLVKEIDGDDWNLTADEDLTPEDVELFEAVMAKYPADDGLPVQISSRWFDTLRTDRPRDGLFDADPVGALVALLVTQIVNVESMVITAGYFWEFPFTRPGTLPHLKKLSLRHGDTELGTDTELVKRILAAAPNLNTFEGFMLSRVSSGFSHDNLTEFHLENSSLEPEHFENIVTGLKNLKSFSYESGGAIVSDSPEATPGEIVRELLVHADTLEHLSFDFQHAFYMEGIADEDLITGLKQMRHLKTLSLAESAIYPEGAHADATDGDFLANLLPTSLEKLTLIGGYDTIMKDILKLAEHLQQFPNMKELELVDMKQDDLATVKTTFNEAKLKITHSNRTPMFPFAQ